MWDVTLEEKLIDYAHLLEKKGLGQGRNRTFGRLKSLAKPPKPQKRICTYSSRGGRKHSNLEKTQRAFSLFSSHKFDPKAQATSTKTTPKAIRTKKNKIEIVPCSPLVDTMKNRKLLLVPIASQLWSPCLNQKTVLASQIYTVRHRLQVVHSLPTVQNLPAKETQ